MSYVNHLRQLNRPLRLVVGLALAWVAVWAVSWVFSAAAALFGINPQGLWFGFTWLCASLAIGIGLPALLLDLETEEIAIGGVVLATAWWAVPQFIKVLAGYVR